MYVACEEKNKSDGVWQNHKKLKVVCYGGGKGSGRAVKSFVARKKTRFVGRVGAIKR